MDITDGSGVGADVAGGDSADAEGGADVDLGREGSSVETAITAAAVRATTRTPMAAARMRSPRLAFGGGAPAAAVMLRIGARPISDGV
jgi:hypothetical protein